MSTSLFRDDPTDEQAYGLRWRLPRYRDYLRDPLRQPSPDRLPDLRLVECLHVEIR